MCFHWNSVAVDELLRDPVIQSVMRADRVDSEDLKATLRVAAGKVQWSRFALDDGLHAPPELVAREIAQRPSPCEAA
jgi:hypothetical protein